MKKTLFACFLMIALVFFSTTFLLLFPYIKAEFLTWRYGEEFVEAYELTDMISAIEYFRVLEYQNDCAKVFYVSENHMTGDLLKLCYEDNQWMLKSWETIWSKSGSADSFLWPFYP